MFMSIAITPNRFPCYEDVMKKEIQPSEHAGVVIQWGGDGVRCDDGGSGGSGGGVGDAEYVIVW